MIIYLYISPENSLLTLEIICTLYVPGGGGFKSPPPLPFFALTHLILKLHYCALVTFQKNIV